MKIYHMSGNYIDDYSVLILSKFDCHMFEVSLNSKMGRSLICAEFTVNNQPCILGTVHLESLNNEETRDL